MSDPTHRQAEIAYSVETFPTIVGFREAYNTRKLSVYFSAC